MSPGPKTAGHHRPKRYIQCVTLDGDSCFRALGARDRRFDGIFYVGVTTTGVYCRPICPARLPKRDRCVFFDRASEAERAGYRACFRCRPELAPGVAAVDSIPRLVRAAALQIEAGYLNERSIEELASSLSVTSRHLRRAMEAELGVSPVELAQARRLAMAKQLLQDTQLPLAQIAFASGFASVRRFNALFRERFRRSPSDVRRAHGRAAEVDSIELRLDYRPPMEWAALLAFLRGREIRGVEQIDEHVYRRSVALGDAIGWVEVRADDQRPALRARVSLSLAPKLVEVRARLRDLFDLDARPDVIAEHLKRDPALAASVAARPGLRVPGAFDGFEMGVRTILGQQVSVSAATTLSGRFAERFGKKSGDLWLFPSPETIARARAADVEAIGLPRARAATLIALAQAIAQGGLILAPASDPDRTTAALESIAGIGPWSSSYLAMRALKQPDAFVAGDLVIQRALGVTKAREAEERSHAWQPWRAYAVMHLWAGAPAAKRGAKHASRKNT